MDKNDFLLDSVMEIKSISMRNSAILERVEDDVKKLNHVTLGNGEAGLTTKFALLTEAVKNLTTKLEEVIDQNAAAEKEEKVETKRSKAAVIVAIVASLPGLIALLL
jgi:hypothetical protein